MWWINKHYAHKYTFFGVSQASVAKLSRSKVFFIIFYLCRFTLLTIKEPVIVLTAHRTTVEKLPQRDRDCPAIQWDRTIAGAQSFAAAEQATEDHRFIVIRCWGYASGAFAGVVGRLEQSVAWFWELSLNPFRLLTAFTACIGADFGEQFPVFTCNMDHWHYFRE